MVDNWHSTLHVYGTFEYYTDTLVNVDHDVIMSGQNHIASPGPYHCRLYISSMYSNCKARQPMGVLKEWHEDCDLWQAKIGFWCMNL